MAEPPPWVRWVPLTCECLDIGASQHGEPDGREVLVVGDAVRGRAGRGRLGPSRGRVIVLGTCGPTDHVEASVLNQ